MAGESVRTVVELLARCAPGVLQAPVSGTLFWTGAGISADLPTGAPVGNSLADRALAYCFAAGTAQIIGKYYRELRVPRSRPRLETLLDVVRRVHGLAALTDVLDDLRRPAPNGLHEFFAAHVGAGGRHVTANFDPCIESAASVFGQQAHILHFHGSFVHDGSGDSLGATLARIERGFPASIQDQLASTLTAPAPQVLTFAGYSGADFFDVDPFLRQIAASVRLAETVVLWINHQDGPPHAVSGYEAARVHPQLGWLAQAGAQVCQLAAPTRLVLDALAAAWGLPPPAPAHGTPHSWQPAITLSGPAREQATLELFALMGLHREVTALLERRGGPATSREWEIAAHTWWAAGRYRQAATAWQDARPGTSPAARLARSERLGATQWIRGQYNRAYHGLRRALKQASALPTGQLDPDLHVQIAETLGRVWVHMRRTPDARLLATRRRRALILHHLPETGSSAEPPLGPHLQARVQSVRADLGAPDATTSSGLWQASQDAFTEYEALHARLNYRHAELRHATPAPSAADLRQLHQDFRAIGADGDAARIPFLPGSETTFTIRETLHGLRGLDITWWHRCRLSVGYIAKRLLTRARHLKQQRSPNAPPV